MTDLFDWTPPPLPEPHRNRAFDGTTYEPREDYTRLKGQLWRVFQLMSDGKWRTLGEIADDAGGSEASVSARLRDLRKPKYGAREVERERVDGGLYRYRLKPLANTTLITGQAA
jgi:hypothetical protein